jgi:hypothetical protein
LPPDSLPSVQGEQTYIKHYDKYNEIISSRNRRETDKYPSNSKKNRITDPAAIEQAKVSLCQTNYL